MAKIITEEAYQQVLEYVKGKLKEQMTEVTMKEPGMLFIGVEISDINNIHNLASYSTYIEQTGGRRKKKPVEGLYIDDWNRFWQRWPSTKSVPGTDMKTGASMKQDEEKTYKLWLSIVQKNRAIGNNEPEVIDALYRAADCYLQWGVHDSIRKGKNEIEMRSGLTPWLNQQKYLIYATMEYPQQQKKVVYENSTDM